MIPHRHVAFTVLLFVACTGIPTRTILHRCPIGYNIVYSKHKGGDAMCYRLKGPEMFDDKFNDCTGNLYTAKLYDKLNFTESPRTLWTDYKSQYKGGPFYDWSHTDATGDLLKNSNITVSHYLSDDELCLVMDAGSWTAVACNEMHHRYCFIRPYESEDDMSDDDCEDLEDYRRFLRPKPVCLRRIKGTGGGGVRASWKQSKELCARKGGSLLKTGWRYSNHPMFMSSLTEPTFPLDIMLNPNSSLESILANDHNGTFHHSMGPPSEWNFAINLEKQNQSEEPTYGALKEGLWYLVNSSYTFYDVICERPIEVKALTMNVTVDAEGKLLLYVNDTIEKDHIVCVTDSDSYYPKTVKVTLDEGSNVFVLKPIADGYYWCTHTDTKRYQIAESTKKLFIREKESLENFYAMKVRLKTTRFSTLEKYLDYWKSRMAEYIFYYNNYIKIYGEAQAHDPSAIEDVLKDFKRSHPSLKYKEKELIYKMKVKQYSDGRWALLHVQMNPELTPVPPGFWDDVEVESMKPVYYCRAYDAIPMLPLGSSTTTSSCLTVLCVGDFNEGVQWVTTAGGGCTTNVHVRTDIENIEVNMPTSLPNKDRDNSSEENYNEPCTTTTEIFTDPTQKERTPKNVTTVTMPTTDAVTIVSESWPVWPPTRPPIPIWPTTCPPTTEPTTTEPPTTETPTTTAPPTTNAPPTTMPPTTTPPMTTSVPLPPEDELQQVMDDLESLLDKENDAPITVDAIGNTFDRVDSLLEHQDAFDIPGNLLHLLDRLGGKVDLNGSHQAAAVRNNIALLMADADPDSPVRGLRIATRDEDEFTTDAFEIISEQVNSTHLSTNSSEAVVRLPESVAAGARRISFVVFRNDRAFPHGAAAASFAVNSRVLSINVQDFTQFEPGEVIDIHLSPISEETERNESRSCAYWHFNEDGSGFWSQDGCTFIRSRTAGFLDTCRCDHLTHFAEVLVPRAVFSETNEAVLEILTIIGCCLSIFGLCMVGVTAAIFRSWRRDYSNKVWLHLCIAIFILVLCFLIVVFTKFDTYDIPCMLLGVALHYSVLASFCWMLVAAVLSYRRLVIVFTRDASHKLLRASAFAWGAPCAVVGVLLSADPHSYAGRFEEKSPSGAFCYPSGLGMWLAVYAPIALMLLANWTLFALIVRSVFASRRIQRHGDTNEAVRCATVSCLLVFLFGLPWLFGLFAYNVVAAYFFTLTATYQGFVLFLFFILGNKKTRDLWLNKLKIKQTRKVPVTSSTYTNRSTTAFRGDPEVGRGAASAERNNSKPKSLASPDNSRFS